MHSRRDFLVRSAALTLAAHPLLAATPANALLFIGTQTKGSSKGIYAYQFNTTTGDLVRTGLAAETTSPTFLALAPDQAHLYAVNETDTFPNHSGALTSFSLDPAGTLVQLSQVPTQGASPCHVAVDHTGTAVFAANYTGGSAIAFHADAGRLAQPPASFFQYTGTGPDKDRQEAPHAHRVTVTPDNRFLLVNDLGLDRIHIYALDPATARLTPTGNDWQAPAGSGPRALLFHPNGKFAYVVSEMIPAVLVLAWDPQAGTLTTQQQLPLPLEKHDGPITGCDIVIDRHARFAYVANRGDDFIASLVLSPDGSRVTFQKRIPSGGVTPRHLALDPTGRWLLVAHQGSNTIAVFPRDPSSGLLADTPKTYPLDKPQCLLFAAQPPK